MRIIRRPRQFFKVFSGKRMILGIGALTAVAALSPVIINGVSALRDRREKKDWKVDFEAYDGDIIAPFTSEDDIPRNDIKEKYEQIIQDMYRQKTKAIHEVNVLKERIAQLEQSINGNMHQ